jgi:hypothetical protein
MFRCYVAPGKPGLGQIRNMPVHYRAAVGRHAPHPAGAIFLKLFRQGVAHLSFNPEVGALRLETRTAQSGSLPPIVAISPPRARASRDITVPIGSPVAEIRS